MKRFWTLMLTLALCLGLAAPALAAILPEQSGTAYASPTSVTLDGAAVTFQMYALRDGAGGVTNYIKLRDLAYALKDTGAKFSVSWDAATGTTISTKTDYTPDGSENKTPFQGDRTYTKSATPLTVDGKPVSLNAFQLTDDNGGGYTYFQLRDLGDAIGFTVDWNAAVGVWVDTKGAGAPAVTVPGSVDAELQRAYDAGLLPGEWVGDMDRIITFAEYSEICTALVEKWDSSKLDEWKSKVKLASASDDPMDTEDGILMLSYIWVLMGRSHDAVDCILLPKEVTDDEMRSLSWNYPLFPDWEAVVYYPLYNSNYMWGGLQNMTCVWSHVSGEFAFPYDETARSWHLQDPMSRDTAVRALLRMAEYDPTVLEPPGDYFDLREGRAYDKSILTDELLSAPTDLPDVTQDKLPSGWKGAGATAYKQFVTEYRHFRRADLQFMADNGFNFTRLFLEFQTLRFPDYPSDPYLVNENELRELDQFLAWCIESGIHLQISMNNYLDENADSTGRDYENGVVEGVCWEVTTAYWVMLAKRYADIPSRFLSFDLCNEGEPEQETDMKDAAANVGEMAREIWSVSPERVCLYSGAGNASVKWMELLAAQGLAVGCHAYKPSFTTLVGRGAGMLEDNPYAEPCWPQPYFPICNVARGRAPLTIRGAVAGAKLSFHIWSSSDRPTVRVYANGKLAETFRPEGELRGNEYFYPGILYSTQLPEDTSEITIKVDGWVRFDTIIIEGSAGKTVMVPSDTGEYPDYTDPLPLIVNPDGSYTNSENIVYNADYIYEHAIKPYQDIAEKYGVGFMVNEFGMAGTDVHWNIDLVNAVHETYLGIMEKYDLPWCYCELQNTFPKHILIMYGDESQWAGATVKSVTYNGVTLKYCNELLDVFRKYTMK